MEKPSPTEMNILKALWKTAPMSAREIHDAVGVEAGWSYSTSRTYVARMVDKGLVARGQVHGLTVFSPAASKVAVLGMMVRAFSAQVFDLDAPLPAAAFADSPILDADELDELEQVLARDIEGQSDGVTS
jgi:BlaI family penicillinase repressor